MPEREIKSAADLHPRVHFYTMSAPRQVAEWVAAIAEMLPAFEFHVQAWDFGRVWGVAFNEHGVDARLGRMAVRTDDRVRIDPSNAVRQIVWLWEHGHKATGAQVLEGREYDLYDSLESLQEYLGPQFGN